MITYHFDLYPRTNPSGTKLVRFTKLQSAEYRGEANGSGSGRFTIRASDPEAAFIDPDGLQYVRVVRDNGVSELVVGGFFLESGEYAALTETSTKLLTYGGAGTLSYLGRAVMDADSWIDDPFIGTDPQPDGTWPLHMAGTGNELGAILWRVLHELEEPGRHQDPVPLMTLGFTYLVDSNAASWVAETGDFVAQVSDTVLSIIRRLMQLGLYVEMDPDDFEVRAYEPGTHRRDRTGGAWGTNVVRFQSPTDGTIATGNIKSDAKRALEAKIRRNAILVGSNDTWEWVTDVGVTVPWEGGYILDDEDGGSLNSAGLQQLAARSDAGDVLRLRMKLGESPTTGEYLPFEHVRLDDLVTVHTGTGQWDYNEAEFPVAALTVALRPGGDWDAWADLGSTYLSMNERAFQAQPIGHHTHPPNPQLCRIGDPDVVLYGPLEWDGGAGVAHTVAIYPSGTDTWPNDPLAVEQTGWVAGGYNGTGGYVINGGAFEEDGSSPALPAFPGQVIRWEGWFWSNGTPQPQHIRFYDAASTLLDTQVWHTINDLNVWAGPYSADLIAPPGTAYMIYAPDVAPLSRVAYDHVTVTVLSGSGFAGDTPSDVGANDEANVGTGTRAARCDHVHPHSDLSDHSDEIHHHADSIEGLTSGAPTDATYLVTTAHAGLSAEVVVGATPGGELGGTWAAPTVDATHSGSTHSAATDTHIADTVDAHDAAAISYSPVGTIAATDTQTAVAEVATDAASALSTHAATAHGGIGPILITSEPAGTPLVFADLLQNSEGTDLLYASEP